MDDLGARLEAALDRAEHAEHTGAQHKRTGQAARGAAEDAKMLARRLWQALDASAHAVLLEDAPDWLTRTEEASGSREPG